MNKFFVFPLLLFCFSSAIAQEVKTFSLENAIRYGINNNDNFKNVLLDEEIRKAFTKENVSIGMPQISAKVDYNWAFKQATSVIPAGSFGPDEMELTFSQPHSASASIQATQLLIDARYLLGLQATKGIKEIASLSTQLNKSELEKNIALAYYGVVVTKSSIDKLLDNEAVLEKLLSDNREMYKEGLIDELTVNRLELNLVNLQTSINKTNVNYENAVANFKFIIGLKSEDEIELTDDLETLTTQTNTDLTAEGSPENRVELRMMKVQDELNGYNVKQSLSSYYPNLHAFVNYGTSAQRSDFNFFNKGRWFQNGMLGLVLNVPVFDGLQGHYKAQQIKLDKEKNLNNIMSFEKSYELEVSVNKNNLLEAQKQLETQTKNKELAEKIFQKTNIMFSEGLGSSFELSQAQADLTTSQINYSQAVYNLIVARYNLKASLKNN